AREPLAVGLRHAAGQLEIVVPQHQTTALARRSSSAQRTTAPAASSPCAPSLSAPKLRRSAPRAWSAVTPIAVSAGLALDSALAQDRPPAAAPPLLLRDGRSGRPGD